MLTLCLCVLAGMMHGRPTKHLLSKLKNVDWQTKFSALYSYIKKYGKKVGRVAVKPLLTFYYIVTDSQTTTLEKAMIYGCIAYVVLPYSIIPRAVYKLLGIVDEAAAILYVYQKIKDKITPEIEYRVQNTIDSWFGTEYQIIK